MSYDTMSQTVITCKFKRKLESLDDISRFILEFSKENLLDEKLTFNINLAVDELFTNAVKYNQKNTNDISISLLKDQDKLTIMIDDYDVEPFDIRESHSHDLTQPLEKRKIGGLGIPFVKEIMDEIDYDYKDQQSRIILIKYLEKDDVQHTD